MVNIKIEIDKILFVLLFALFLFIGPASLFEQKIKHDFPYAYFASDAFQHQVRAEAVKDAGNFKHEAFYISLGFKETIGRYPPLIYHIAAIFSYAAGIEVYDAFYFLVLLFAVTGVLLTYFIIRDFNKNVALISMPLAIMSFFQPASTGILWGHWPSVVSQVFLIGFAWGLMRAGLKKAWFLIAIFFASMTLTHTSEAIFALIFLALFLAIRFFSKNLKKTEVINILVGLIISFIISLYYLIIFQNTWAKAQPWSFTVEPVWQGNPGFYLINFGILLLFIALGILFSAFRLKEMHTSLIFAFAMLLSGFLNYVGFSVRSFQIRFFWPIYLSVFFGFGVYMLLKFVIKKWGIVYTAIICAIFVVLLTGLVKLPAMPYYTKMASQGIMDNYHWNALKWLSKNTEQDSKIYFLYGDIYSQDALLRNSKRLHYQVVPDDFVKALNERKIKRHYVSELPGDGGGKIAIRKGLFNFEYPADTSPQENFFGPQDICMFDYIVLDKVSRQPVLAQYNLLVASEMLKNSYIKRVFENEAVAILENSKTGDDCIEERSF